nr:protein FAR1-RELATED SEQUENCE 5-like [Arachis hypogaea]
MKIKKKNKNMWYVSRFIEEHNHELLLSKFVEYLRSHRKISDFEKAQLNSMREIGISIPKIYESFATQAGGFNMVSFTKQDMYNVLRRLRAMQNGDVNATFRYLEGIAQVDEKLFWRYKTGPSKQLCDLFWSDGASQEDYRIFGDVLAFDATYGRNKYNLPVVVFSGVNHHNQTCVFGAAMVSHESQESYNWVLERFLECMKGKTPNAVITDGDPAMGIAIQKVFPEAHHRLCAWHLLRNATANISQPQFTQLFRQCMLADIDIHEFEKQWEAMLEECGVREVEWMRDLYAKKYSWTTAYIRGRFYAGLRTTSRCESLHTKLGRFVESRYGILEFITNFQRCIDFLRDNEAELDFRSCYGTPVLQTEFVELEKSAALKFTREIFFRVRESLKRSVRININGCNHTSNGDVFLVEKYRKSGLNWQVLYDGQGQKFGCSCMRMESFGLPCIHILAVVVRLNLCAILDSLVLKRWSKIAKSEADHWSIVNEAVNKDILYKRKREL